VRGPHQSDGLSVSFLCAEPDEFDIGFDGSSDDAADEADDTRPDVEEGDDESTTRQVCELLFTRLSHAHVAPEIQSSRETRRRYCKS